MHATQSECFLSPKRGEGRSAHPELLGPVLLGLLCEDGVACGRAVDVGKELGLQLLQALQLLAHQLDVVLEHLEVQVQRLSHADLVDGGAARLQGIRLKAHQVRPRLVRSHLGRETGGAGRTLLLESAWERERETKD